MLFILPQDLIAELLTDWFASREITVLDSSVCNKDLRFSLLNLFSSCLFIHQGRCLTHRIHTNNFFNCWILLRKIKIKSLALRSVDMINGGFESLLSEKLRSLNIEFDYWGKSKVENSVSKLSLRFISAKCSELRNLEIEFYTSGNEFEALTFINRNIHLESVQFFNDSSLGNKCLRAISKSCVNIQEIHFHHMAQNVDLVHIIEVLKVCKSLRFITIKTYEEDRMFRMHVTTDLDVKMCCVRLTGFEEASEKDKQGLMESFSGGVYVLWLKAFWITDVFITSSLQKLSELQFLTLDSCGALFSSVGLIELVSFCKKLNKVHLISCSHLSNVDLKDILTMKGNVLEVIGISCHEYLDLDTLSMIVAANKSVLTQIFVSNCAQLQHEGETFKWLELNLQSQNSKIKMCGENIMI
jgi:hypothetical protein